MNTERIWKAKDGISGYQNQINALLMAQNGVEEAINHFLEVNPHYQGHTAHENNLAVMRNMLSQIGTQIRVAQVRIINLKTVIDEEVNA